MKKYLLNDFTELFYINDNFSFLIRSYTYDLNFLYLLSFPELTLIRQGTYAYCYDYILDMNNFLKTNDNLENLEK